MSLSISVGPPTERSGLLYGRDDTPNLIGFGVEGPDRIRIFIREKEGVNSWTAAFEPFLFLTDEDRLKGWKGDCRMEPLAGYAKFRRLVSFPDLATLDSAKTYLQKKSGKRLTDPGASYLYFNDPIQQHLLTSGSTHFLGMRFADLRRMQIDLETYCDADFEFPNAERESDRITAIAMSDTMGWERVITGREFDEAEMIAEMVGEIQRRDPDVLEGHNFFRFDLRYLRARAKRYGLELNLGRNGSTLKGRSARMDFGDRRLSFMNYEIFGRHVIDTWFLAQRYDLRTSELEGHGLKDVARHFGVVPAGRTYIPGEKASWYFDHEPDTLFRYALDDVRETRAVSDVLSPPYFLQAQIFPCTYQHVALQDDVSKIDTLLLREYLAQRRSIPAPMAEQTRVVALPDLRFRGVEWSHFTPRSCRPTVISPRMTTSGFWLVCCRSSLARLARNRRPMQRMTMPVQNLRCSRRPARSS
jgi:DNA polymerase, archaea type